MVLNNAINYSNILIFEKSPTIDFTVLNQVQTIFTTENYQFLALSYGSIITQLSSLSIAPIYSIGWTPPLYQDYLNAAGSPPETNVNTFDNQASYTQAGALIVPANTALKVIISTAATATTMKGNVFVYGFYLR